MVIDQIVAELRYIQKEPKITNFASSTTLSYSILNSNQNVKARPAWNRLLLTCMNVY